MKNLALVTGASGGIGLELARLHAARGGDLVLVARSEDKLEALAAELSQRHGITAHVFARDLSRIDAAEELAAALERKGLAIDVLINNAGFGGHGKFHERDWTADKAMIQLNVVTLTGLTRLLLPGMVARGHGRILNLASMAAFLPGPLQAVYYATKAFVLSFSEAIANELEGTGVTVTVLCPGATETGFAATGGLEDVKAFANADAPDGVARAGYAGMLRGKTVVVPSLAKKIATRLPGLLPRGLVTRISRATMEQSDG